MIYCKFITANDTGSTGGHQYGYHISKSAWSLLFDEDFARGHNRERFVTIHWKGYGETASRFIYYGTGTRNEYRITRFGKGFPFLSEKHEGSLLVIEKVTEDYYRAEVIDNDDAIDEFLAKHGVDFTRVNTIIDAKTFDVDSHLQNLFEEYLQTLDSPFPTGALMSSNARKFALTLERADFRPCDAPDDTLSKWLDIEYRLFRYIEADRMKVRLQSLFTSVDEFVDEALSVINRRKNRAGGSLEQHLHAIFTLCGISHTPQAKTENGHTPDFIFPGQEQYHDTTFDDNKLIVLACKTTCKDRWRQVLTEADRIKRKYLFTLQQAISAKQLDEMERLNVVLVVPSDKLKTFPSTHQDKVMTLGSFMIMVSQTQQCA